MMLSSYISISKDKQYVIGMLFLLLILIISHVIYFEKFSRYLIKNDYSTKRFQAVNNNGYNIKVAAIGTSHTQNGLKNDFDYFFNYGRQGTLYPVAYAKISHLLKHAPNLKVLLLEADHIDILIHDHKKIALPKNHLYLLKHTIGLPNEKTGTTNTGFEKFMSFVSLKEDVAPVIHKMYLSTLLNERHNKNEDPDLWGKLTAKEKIESAKKRVSGAHLDKILNIDQAVRDYYIKAIDEANKLGVKVYLILYPQTKEYFSSIDKKNLSEVNKFVLNLAQERNITILDYRHYFGSNDKFFKNQDHLNEKGRELLTREVMEAIKNDL